MTHASMETNDVNLIIFMSLQHIEKEGNKDSVPARYFTINKVSW